MFKQLVKKIKALSENSEILGKRPVYRVADIIKDDKGHYQVVVQLIGKKDIFKMQPEEILADDSLTTLFHQYDVRLLTYLGYCGINTPQYKILAKKMLANEEIELAIYDSKADKHTVKKADDIAKHDLDMIKKMPSEDAYDLGFAHGRKSVLEEKELFNKILEE